MARRGELEKRWIVLSEDGRHATLGRYTDPTEDEIQRAAEGLRGAGIGGWLAVTEGVYYSRGRLSVLQVRELVHSEISWQDAVKSFLDMRAKAIQPHPV